ncbi:MAG: zinc-ribbon domain-containing protein [Hydrogenophaga sp.]|jgi:predicted Zn finger-like uncharacterized protein|nr:zinc-ribbon domain-containing protein [Hydrogenophaga sp.]
MSFITRCPACSTSFKVVADQLRVSQGWVRCGHCAEIFDANQDLKPWVPTPPVLTNVVDEQQQPSDQAWARQASDAEAVHNDTPLTEVLEGLSELSASQHSTDVHVDAVQPNHGVGDELASPEAMSMDQDPVLHIDVLQADGDDSLNEAFEPEPRFVQQAKRHVFWASKRVRASLWAGVCLGGLSLALQWAVHDRDRLAAWQPALKPLLTAVCQPFGCRIEAVRQVDAVVIDSSGLVRLLGQLHAMDVVLKNTQAWPVAMPSLELSLTDGQDQVLARRVLLAKDWPDAPPVLQPGQAWPVKLRLSIALAGDQAMAGYRIALFYP